MLVTERDGWIRGRRTGLFDHDTRYFATYEISFEEFTPTFLTAQQAAYNCAILTYTNPGFRAGREMVDEYALYLKLVRVVEAGLHESFEITSYARRPVSFRLIVSFECTFEDIFEVRGLRRAPPRVIQQRYDDRYGIVECVYRDEWFSRCLHYRIQAADSQPRYSPNLLIFPIRLLPDQTWRVETAAEMDDEPRGRFAHSRSVSLVGQASGRERSDVQQISVVERLRRSYAEIDRWIDRLPRLHAASHCVQRAYDQALRDLASLRFQKVGDEWYPAAGVPWYNTIFGRDALITAYQCLPLGCPFPRAVLARLAERQGKQVNTWNDEEPGKIPHELRVGQLALMGKIPFNPFYGSVDASLLYVILLAEAYRFSGDRGLLEDFIAPVEGCLRWAAEYGDVDGDGFIEYWLHSPHDFHNQSWKDSPDAVVYPDGQVVPDPIAIVEVQGYYYDALCSAAELYRILGETAKADATAKRAERLYAEFNARYWLPDEGFYAYGLDPEKRPIRTIASNPGQLLWSRIVPPDRAAKVSRRLLADDMFDGWGIRTLSSQNGAYAPLMYQRGSVWPHDNALIAFGMKRYNHWQEANRIAEGIFSASGLFAHGRLPELWAGLGRAETHWPVLYPKANVPQAWAAGSVPLLLRAILGLEPDASQRCLLLQPTLPPWFDELTIERMPFAGETVDLHLQGTGPETKVEVLRTSGSITIEHRPIRKEAA